MVFLVEFLHYTKSQKKIGKLYFSCKIKKIVKFFGLNTSRKTCIFRLVLPTNIVEKVSFSTQIVEILTSFNYLVDKDKLKNTCLSTSEKIMWPMF
jgi:hypothetical protein